MKLNKLAFLFILLLLPVLLTGCSKIFPTPFGNNTGGNENSEDPGDITDPPADTPVPTVTEIPSVATEIPSAETSGSGTTLPSDTDTTSGQGGSSDPDSSSGQNGSSDSGSSADSYKTRAEEFLSHMTLEEKVGQMFLFACAKTVQLPI